MTIIWSSMTGVMLAVLWSMGIQAVQVSHLSAALLAETEQKLQMRFAMIIVTTVLAVQLAVEDLQQDMCVPTHTLIPALVLGLVETE